MNPADTFNDEKALPIMRKLMRGQRDVLTDALAEAYLLGYEQAVIYLREVVNHEPVS